jgi:phosphoglycerate dehydrogenase-like enzyme
MRALILAPFAERYLRRLRRALEVTYDSWTESRRLHSPEELAARLRQEEASVLVVEADFVFDEVFDAVPGLRLVGVCRNAFHQVDVDEATERGVLVVHAPGRNAAAVAELTLALMLALGRHLVTAHRLVAEGRWRDPTEAYFALQGRELAGSVVGVVGLGHIGREVASRLRALGAGVLAYDPYVPPRRMRALGVTPAELPELMRRSDFVTIHAALTDESEGLVDEALLRLMKPQAYLINTAAAAVVDQTALVRCLEERRVAGAALDVFEGQPLPSSSPYLRLDNVILTPHIGGATRETVERHSRMITGDIERFLRGLPPRRLVNPEALSRHAR